MAFLSPPDPVVIDTEEDALRLLNDLMEQSEVAIDTETTGLSFVEDSVTHWSLSYQDTTHDSGANRLAIDVALLPLFSRFFLDERIDKIFHNALFDLVMLNRSGVQVKGRIFCTKVMDSLLDENRFGNHGLKECAWDYFGIVADDFMSLFKGMKISTVPISDPTMSDYASKDAWITLLLKWKLQAGLEAEVVGRRNGRDYTLWDLHNRFFCDINRIVADMCIRGWEVDKVFLSSLIPLLQKDIERIDKIFNQEAMRISIELGRPLWAWDWEVGSKHKRVEKVYPGGYLNPGSDRQLRHFLFEVLEYPVIEYTDGGDSGNKQPSVSDDVLEELRLKHLCAFAGLVQQRRDLQKTLSTYLLGIVRSLDRENRVHSSLLVMGARTGRFASRSPNLQNIRKPESDPYVLRRAFIAKKGYKIIALDYQTLEMVILANMSECSDLRTAITSGLDLHCWTASVMFGIPYDDLVFAKKNEHNIEIVGAEKRRIKELVKKRSAAKAIGFGEGEILPK